MSKSSNVSTMPTYLSMSDAIAYLNRNSDDQITETSILRWCDDEENCLTPFVAFSNKGNICKGKEFSPFQSVFSYMENQKWFNSMFKNFGKMIVRKTVFEEGQSFSCMITHEDFNPLICGSKDKIILKKTDVFHFKVANINENQPDLYQFVENNFTEEEKQEDLYLIYNIGENREITKDNFFFSFKQLNKIANKKKDESNNLKKDIIISLLLQMLDKNKKMYDFAVFENQGQIEEKISEKNIHGYSKRIVDDIFANANKKLVELSKKINKPDLITKQIEKN